MKVTTLGKVKDGDFLKLRSDDCATGYTMQRKEKVDVFITSINSGRTYRYKKHKKCYVHKKG